MPLTSAHWGTYYTEVRGGKLVGMQPFGQDADPSDIGKGLVGTLDAPTRITAPMVRKGWLDGRKGQRGKDSFVEVSWSDALSLVADELSRVKAEQGNRGIFAGCYGWASAGRFHHAQSQIHRFMNCIGGYKRSGLGRENGQQAIMAYLQQKSVWIATETSAANPFIMK